MSIIDNNWPKRPGSHEYLPHGVYKPKPLADTTAIKLDPEVFYLPPMQTVGLGVTYNSEDATEVEIVKACNDLAQTLINKRRDYGKGNIAEFGALGILVRASDKLHRLKNLSLNVSDSHNYEPSTDSWKDLAGYAIIGLINNEGKW